VTMASRRRSESRWVAFDSGA